MGKEVVYCLCGNRLLEEDFKGGRAFEILHRSACPKCKDQVINSLSPEERERYQQKVSPRPLRRPKAGISSKRLPSAGRRPPSTTRRPSARKRDPSSDRLRGSKVRRLRPATSKRIDSPQPEPSQRANPLPFIITALLIVLVLIVVAIVISRETDKPPPSRPPSGPSSSGPREEAAALKAYSVLLAAVEEDPSRTESHLEAIGAALKKFKGTRTQARLQRLETEVRELRDARERRAVTVYGLIELVKRESSNYQTFDKHEEVMKKLDEAAMKTEAKIEAGRFSFEPRRLRADVEQARKEYLWGYGKTANQALKEVKDLVRRHLSDREPYKAIMAIERFGSMFASHAGNQELQAERDRILKSVIKAGEWRDAFNGMDLTGWTRIEAEGTRNSNWRARDGVLIGRSSFREESDRTVYSDLFYYDLELRDFEMVLEYEANIEGAMQLLLRTEVGPGGIRKQGTPLTLDARSNVIIITVEGNELSGTFGDRSLARTVPSFGKVLLKLRHGATVSIKKLRLNPLR